MAPFLELPVECQGEDLVVEDHLAGATLQDLQTLQEHHPSWVEEVQGDRVEVDHRVGVGLEPQLELLGLQGRIGSFPGG